MSVKIRLRRTGRKKQPSYRIVVADERSPRDGRFIEIIGNYNPLTNPPVIIVDLEKVKAWMLKGAKPSETVRSLLREVGRTAKAKESAEPKVSTEPVQA